MDNIIRKKTMFSKEEYENMDSYFNKKLNKINILKEIDVKYISNEIDSITISINSTSKNKLRVEMMSNKGHCEFVAIEMNSIDELSFILKGNVIIGNNNNYIYVKSFREFNPKEFKDKYSFYSANLEKVKDVYSQALFADFQNEEELALVCYSFLCNPMKTNTKTREFKLFKEKLEFIGADIFLDYNNHYDYYILDCIYDLEKQDNSKEVLQLLIGVIGCYPSYPPSNDILDIVQKNIYLKYLQLKYKFELPV